MARDASGASVRAIVSACASRRARSSSGVGAANGRSSLTLDWAKAAGAATRLRTRGSRSAACRMEISSTGGGTGDDQEFTFQRGGPRWRCAPGRPLDDARHATLVQQGGAVAEPLDGLGDVAREQDRAAGGGQGAQLGL